VRGLQAAELLRRPVLVRGIRLGRVDDVIFDPDGSRVVGFDVLCGDGLHRFLPFPSATLEGDRLEVRSTLSLLDGAELDFYRRNGRSVTEGSLRDAVVGMDGLVALADAVGDGVGHC
jgi:hypothetical protein